MTARRLAVRAAARALHSSWEGRIRRKRERQGIDPVVQVRAPLALAPIRGTPAKAVERHLWQRDDNYEKLIQAKTGEGRRADEAHLLIWVPCGEPHRNGAHAAARSSMIELGDIPKPDLRGIDTVWVAIHGESNSKAGRPLLPVFRLDADGWSRYECVWQRSEQDTGP